MIEQWILDNVKNDGFSWPLKKAECAKVLGISLTKFQNTIKEHPYYHKNGARYRFSPSDVQKIWDAMLVKPQLTKPKSPSFFSEFTKEETFQLVMAVAEGRLPRSVLNTTKSKRRALAALKREKA